MRGERVRWILAFDGGCARCRALSQTVQAMCEGDLEILPLGDIQVQRWSTDARPGRAMKWVPTLFRIEHAAVRMWTGPALSVRLVLHLGPQASFRLLRAIGAAPTAGFESTSSIEAPTTATRRRFLELGAGGIIAMGILLTGAIPAMADPVAAWIKDHRGRLPRTYPELALLPLEYRTAIYQELTPAERSAAWVEHLESARASAPDLTDEQTLIFDETLVLARDPNNFRDDRSPPPTAPALADRGIAAFGVDRARTIFATLGPDSGEPAAPTATCGCSTFSDYCTGHCQQGGCSPISPGCGFLYQYTCNGLCR